MFFRLIQIIYFFINEVKLTKYKLKITFSLCKEISIYKFIRNFFFKETYLFKNENINKYLKKNKKLNKRYQIKNDKNILIDLTLNSHPLYAISNCYMGMELAKLNKLNIVGNVIKNDYLTYFIAKSFGIKNFIFIDEGSFFNRLSYFIKSLKLIPENKIAKKIVSITLDKIEIGKASYEHAIRNYKYSPLRKNNFLLYLALSKSLRSLDLSKKIFNKYQFKYYILSELQFIPNRIFFQRALLMKIPVYSKIGNDQVGATLYKSFSKKNLSRDTVSKESSNFIKKKLFQKKNLIEKFHKNQLVKNAIGSEVYFKKHIKSEISKIIKNKNELYKQFGFDIKKPIVLILPHVMIDNVLNFSSSIFLSPMFWYIETLKIIKIIKDVNWLIKPHPSEPKYDTELTSKNLFKNYVGDENHVKFWSKDVLVSNIDKYINSVITCLGSSGYQYPSLGIPSITTAESKYSHFNCSISPKNKKEYFKILINIKKLSKLDYKTKLSAKIFWFVNEKIIRVKNTSIPTFDDTKQFNQSIFWNIMQKSVNKRNKNIFNEMLKIQDKNQNRHTINFKELQIQKFKYKKIKFNDA
jgi:hypothetical protein